MPEFERPRHRLVWQVLEALDRDFLADARCWFAGGMRLTVERSDAEPDVTLGVELLASLVFAHGSASRLAAAGCLTGSPEALDTLDRLLAWPRPAWSSHMS